MSTALSAIAQPKMPRGDSDESRTPEFLVLKQLALSTWYVAYSGRELPSGADVEIRHLSAAALNGDRGSVLRQRVAAVQLIRHPAVRAVVDFAPGQTPPRLVLEVGQVESLATLDLAIDANAIQRALTALHATAAALTFIHRLGVAHGRLSLATIELARNLPRLDLLHLECDDSSLPAGEARAQDVRAFADVLSQLLTVPSFNTFCHERSARITSQLRQFCAQAALVDPAELPPLSEVGRWLQELTAEQQPVVEAKTSAIENQPALSDRTAAIDNPSERIAPPVPVDALPRVLRPGDQLGRFRIEQKLGEGGMGSVFRAQDLSTGQTVAVKVLSLAAASSQSARQRFQKEARLLASLQNPHVTNLIEFNDEDGLHYLVLEFATGNNAKQLVVEHGALSERDALEIAAGAARGLAAAHERGIVHLDVKPENILVGSGHPKLIDFGIARFVDQSQSLAMTRDGALIGTPLYMSPEQFKGRNEVGPASDVYSLGATMFDLLTGRPPFLADDPVSLAGLHALESVPDLRRLNPRVTEPVATLVQRCLAKHPADRFADASHLLREIEKLLRGEPSEVNLHPQLPPHDANRILANQFVWELQSPPEELWPYVSNTDRLNRALGLPAVVYTSEAHPQLGTRRFGTVRIAGMKMTWEEHPFEWIEGRRMSVLRQFQNGPFEWFVSCVELQRTPQGGTRLSHRVQIAPRHFLGRLIARLETGIKCQRSLHKIYERIDRYLKDRRMGLSTGDPFEAPPALAAHQQTRLTQRAARLLLAGIPAEVADALHTYLATASPQDVSRIRPLALADHLAVDEQLLTDACLVASQEGLLKLEWELLCPICRVAADTRASLNQLTAHANCEACQIQFETGVAGAVELVFRAHPEVRTLETGKYCIGGPWHAPHVAAQLRLEPGERLEVELELMPGDYLLRGPRLGTLPGLRILTSGQCSREEIVLEANANVLPRTALLRPGKQVLFIENRYDVPQVLRIERTIPRDDVLTAAAAAALPRFRQLFPGEVLEPGNLVATERVALVAVTLPRIDELYASVGDAQAYHLVQQNLRQLEQVIQAHRGEVVKTIGEGLLAAFTRLADAVEAAFELDTARQPSSSRQLAPAVGVHWGPTIVTTLNGQLDYFGATARQTAALPLASGAGVALTEDVFADPQVAGWLAATSRPSEIRTVSLPGRPHQVIRYWATHA